MTVKQLSLKNFITFDICLTIISTSVPMNNVITKRWVSNEKAQNHYDYILI